MPLRNVEDTHEGALVFCCRRAIAHSRPLPRGYLTAREPSLTNGGPPPRTRSDSSVRGLKAISAAISAGYSSASGSLGISRPAGCGYSSDAAFSVRPAGALTDIWCSHVPVLVRKRGSYSISLEGASCRYRKSRNLFCLFWPFCGFALQVGRRAAFSRTLMIV